MEYFMPQPTQNLARVITPYKAAFPDPWVMHAGDKLAIGREDTEWPGWLWCTRPDGESRWVPDSFVEVQGDAAGVALVDYDATELSVEVGETLTTGQEVNAWVWCTNQEGHSGWVPAKHLQKLGH